VLYVLVRMMEFAVSGGVPNLPCISHATLHDTAMFLYRAKTEDGCVICLLPTLSLCEEGLRMQIETRLLNGP
jgi:hypothetical protein